MELVIATRNKKKRQEIKEILKDCDIDILSLEDYPGFPDIKEEGTTFEDNAVKKSVVVAKLADKWALADDSGLEVEALGGRPGVHSARFAGKEQNDEANIKKLLKLMEDVPEQKRMARFSCFIAISKPAGEVVKIVKGSCEGWITFKPRGKHGFGYDPVFITSGQNKTFAELKPDLKNQISHRARALRKVKEFISQLSL